MSKSKVVLVGAGNIARTQAAALKEVPDTELCGVLDVNTKVFTRLEDAAELHLQALAVHAEA